MKKNTPAKLLASRYRVIKKITDLGQGKEEKYVCMDIRTNKKVFVKISKSHEHLESEYRVQQYFYSEFKKTKGGRVITPKPILLTVSGGKTIMVSEYLELRNIIKMRNNKKAKIYSEVFETLKSITAVKGGFSKIKYLKKRGTIYLLLTVPYFALKDIFAGSDYKIIFRSLFKISESLVYWLSLEAARLCHGDINTTNIFVSHNKIVLLDFGEAALSHKYYDLSKAVNSSWYQPAFSDTLLETLFFKKTVKANERKVFASFAIYNLLQRLSVAIIDKKRKFYINQLNKFLAYD